MAAKRVAAASGLTSRLSALSILSEQIYWQSECTMVHLINGFVLLFNNSVMSE